MTHGEPGAPPGPPAAPAVRPSDPAAVALGNASLLGVGYLMLGRGHLAVTSVLITAELFIIFASAAQTLWFGIVVALWWVALVAHGWLLAGGWPRGRRPDPQAPRPRPRSWRRRGLAVAAVLPVLLAVSFLRYDVARIEDDAAAGGRAGDCARVEDAVDRVTPAHRMVALSPGENGEHTVRACVSLRAAATDLTDALAGDTDALDRGLRTLAAILRAEPADGERLVRPDLDRFINGLPVENPCTTVEISTRLAERPPTHPAIDRVGDVVPRVTPTALVGCGDEYLGNDDLEAARRNYQRLVDEYPSHELVTRARGGLGQVFQRAELANLRRLLTPGSGSLPPYCSAPAPFSAAPGGPNRALVFGGAGYVDKLPGEWKAGDLTQATRVVCVEAAQQGSAAESCRYTGGITVTFYRIALPVRVYDLRTGQLLTDTRIEINGTSCPSLIYGYDASRDVSPSNADVEAAFRPVINP